MSNKLVRFLRAGSDVIGTVTYQASIDGFVQYASVTSEGALDLIRCAVRLAREARDEYWETEGSKTTGNGEK